MKTTLLLLTITLASCATQPDGTKTFAGLTGTQWLGVGVKTGSAYLGARTPVTSGKEAPDEAVVPETPWYLTFFGL